MQMMHEIYSTGSRGGIGITEFFLNIIIILIIVAAVIALLNRSNYMAGGREQLARMEKDLEEVKKIVEDIKNKLDEI